MAERKLKEAESLYLKATTGEPFQAQFVPSYVRVSSHILIFESIISIISIGAMGQGIIIDCSLISILYILCP